MQRRLRSGARWSETTEPLLRAALLPAYAEIMLAVGDSEAARSACSELAEIAARSERAMLDAIAAHARGAVELAEGDARAAARRPCVTRGRSGRSSRRRTRRHAPASSSASPVVPSGTRTQPCGSWRRPVAPSSSWAPSPDLTRVDTLTGRAASAGTHGLSPRELEVLRLVAAGNTNRQIASELVVSEHTVARHVQNIFTKLGVSSRTAATAFAFERDLV